MDNDSKLCPPTLSYDTGTGRGRPRSVDANTASDISSTRTTAPRAAAKRKPHPNLKPSATVVFTLGSRLQPSRFSNIRREPQRLLLQPHEPLLRLALG